MIERTRDEAGQEAPVLSAREEAAAWVSVGEIDESLEALAVFVNADPRFQELVSTRG